MTGTPETAGPAAGGSRKVLFVSPYVPTGRHGGDRSYTLSLLNATSNHAAIHAVGLHDGRGMVDGSSPWQATIVKRPYRPKVLGVLTPYPNIVYQVRCRELIKTVWNLAQACDWACIVCNHLNTWWALDVFRRARCRAGRPAARSVLIAHNHESAGRMSMARLAAGLPRKLVYFLDACKIAVFERAALRRFDEVVALSPTDADAFRSVTSRPVTVLTPGYDGPVVRRTISRDAPRQAVMLGSLFWEAKQINLGLFLAAAVPVFRRNGVKLTIVGDGPARFLAGLRRRYPEVTFTGWVDDPQPFLSAARVGIVSEPCGTGFKLKALDYIFSSVPVAALTGNTTGLPLVPARDFIDARDPGELARHIADRMGDDVSLNRLASNALAACEGRFDWETRGRELAALALGRG